LAYGDCVTFVIGFYVLHLLAYHYHIDTLSLRVVTIFLCLCAQSQIIFIYFILFGFLVAKWNKLNLPKRQK